MTAEKTSQLLQKSMLAPPIQFTLLRGRELEIACRARKNTQIYKVDLLALRAPSERVVNIAWNWWLASLGTMILLIGLVLLLSSLSLDISAVLVGVIGILFSLMLVFVSWQKGARQQIFYGRHSSVPLVSLQLGIPSKKELQKFVSRVEEQIEALRKKYKLTRDQELAGEMRTLRRLTNDGVISLDEYENSKEVLFQKH